MAEIRIEKKKPVWPWVLLVLLVILALLYFFVWSDDNMNNRVEDNTMETDTLANTLAEPDEPATYGDADMEYGGVVGYVVYVGNTAKMGVDHTYTNRALLYLADALKEVAVKNNVDVASDLQTIREKADYVTKNPEATDHAGNIKEAGNAVVSIMSKLQTQNYPQLANEVKEVETAVQKIDPKVLTLDQKDAVKSFYAEAADVLDKMK